MICGTPKPHIPEFCCTGLLACCNKSDVVVGELAVVSVSYLNPDTVELGRSFVTLEYQSSSKIGKGLFALDNLWDGLGALTIVLPNIKYFFGKMTMYPSFHRRSRDLILYFLNKHFGDKDAWVIPVSEYQSLPLFHIFFSGVRKTRLVDDKQP